MLRRLYLMLVFLPFFFITASTAISKELPRPLSASDADLYEQIFALQDDGKIKKAAKLIKQLDSQLLMGHVLAQKYLHPTAWRSSFTELSQWLKKYNDHPTASRIKWLSDRRRPKNTKAAKSPKKGYLNGVGLSRPQSFRADIPESWSGRASPRTTAKIARDIRRSIRRGYPSGAVQILDKPSNLRYLTATEEAHLRGEIAHAYFIFGVDDKAARTARQAIAKGGESAYMGYWAGGLAAWRSGRYEIATSFFRTLAENKRAPEVLRAGAGFWAYRGYMLAGDPLQAMYYLNMATAYPETFYGVMAIEASGQSIKLDFNLPTITDEFMAWLTAQDGGQRALALLQIGDWTRAARELRYLFEEMPEQHVRSLIAFTSVHNMPGLTFRLADIYKTDKGISYLAALYPYLETEADVRIDLSLLHAIIRKESGFYPLARSRAKAAGLMQLMPATAAFIARDKRYRRTHRHKLHDPELNLTLAQDYIEHLNTESHIKGDLVLMLAAYNGGPGNLRKWLRKVDHREDRFLLIESIPARETRNYIKGVISYMFIYSNRFDEEVPALRHLIAGSVTDKTHAQLQN